MYFLTVLQFECEGHFSQSVATKKSDKWTMTCLVAHDGPAAGAIRLVNNGAATNYIQ